MNRHFFGTLVVIFVALSLAVSKSYACSTAPTARIPDYTGRMCVGCTAEFDGLGSCVPPTGSYDYDNESPYGCGHGISKYEWDFGDESDPCTAATPSHTYTTADTYTVELKVTDDDDPNQSDTTTCTVYVVKVDKVVEWGSIPENTGPLYVGLEGHAYLEAKAYPAVSFPTGEPHWIIEDQPPDANASLYVYSSRQFAQLYNLNVPGDYIVRAKCGDDDEGDTITVIVVESNLNIKDVPDDDEEDPGGYVSFNNDDDDDDGVVDYDDGYNKDEIPDNNDDTNPNEDNLVEISLSVTPSLSTGEVELRLDDYPFLPNVRVWSSPTKGEGNMIIPDDANYYKEWPVQSMPTTLYVEGISPSWPRADTLWLSYKRDGATIHTDTVNFTVLDVDLDADSDRTGTVERTLQEDEAEMISPAIMVVNFDDDDDDGYPPDNNDNIMDVNDNDFVYLVIQKMVLLPDGWEAWLSVSNSDAEKLRIFDESDTARIGPDPLADEYKIPDITTSDLYYEVEANSYPEGAGDFATVSLIVKRADESEFFRDEVRFMPTPYILLPNTAPYQLVYVSDDDPNFAGVLGGIVSVLTPLMSNSNDQFLQDDVEIGYTHWPHWPLSKNMQVIWDLPHNAGLDDWPEDRLFDAGYGLFEKGQSESGAAGGNVEVSPPITVGETEYKLGRAVVGSDCSSLVSFINAQDVQTPVVQCDTSWLYVGHIDEVISFIPDPDGEGFKVLIASTHSGRDLLKDLHDTDSGTASGGSSNTLVDSTKDWGTDPDQWAGGFIEITDGNCAGQVRRIVSNNSNTITITSTHPWKDDVPNSSSKYQLVARSAYRTLFAEGEEDCGVATDWTSNTLTDETKDWSTVNWAGGYVKIVEGKGSVKTKEIFSSTADTITITGTWFIEPDDTSRYILVESSKIWQITGEVAFRGVRQMLLDPTFILDQDLWQANIEFVRLELRTELGLAHSPPTNSDFIEIPALFEPVGVARRARGWMPDMVNLLVCGSTLAIPKPFGPRNPTDIFKNDVETKLDDPATNFDVHFIDDWDTYHSYYGEIHCGTNVKRTPPGINWWE